ncbi:hypothetical protein QCA50_015890 [Cerrena zonata]|uniref:Translation machinery-associated protein 16 n=1 Tax=Cerrena zonata TaxID=2478898 RepID=A0AAW0FH64_9APHY
MPIIKNLNKVNKNLAKSTGQMHIKGPKKMKHQEQKDNELRFIVHLQEKVNEEPEKVTFGLQDMKDFVESYISKDDEEIKELQDERRPGRPATARQNILEEKRKHDQHIYDTGYKLPDLSDKQTVERLRLWNGTHGGVTIMKYIHIHKDMKDLPTKEAEMKD